MRETYEKERQLQLVDAIKANDPIALKEFYMSNYSKIEALVLKNSGSVDHAKDLYQESFIAVWKNLKTKTFQPKNNTALEGYLYQIAKNKWMDVLRSNAFKKTNPLTNDKLIFLKQNDDELNDVKEEQLKTILKAFKNLGQPCKQLLTDFYYSKKPLRVIASELDLEEASVRNKKYRCMEKLRSIVFSSKP
ncbi:sigma-70 family RNA polymerase sigma factor [uncultured Psychroserpens sp.]|uniref:RNA polymerase sigma factor n=1 Tax=uncultured Psychroserpens sp. TaxID=255436 RepID=UPI002633648F|nr:sigma-70 family RNA polymerase sigma factor [uncultured Psychroserpens sp.]